MDLKSRLSRVEKGYLLNEHLFPEMPAFKNWSDTDLNKYIKDSVEQTHKEQNIKSYTEGVAYYNRICESGGISEKEKKLHLQMEKDYFDGKY